MTVLANAITASTSVIHISAPLTVGSYQAPYTLDSEAILITGGSGTSALSVERGQNGTARAAHVAGTTLTSGWGGGGAVQTVSLLGPVAVHFNTSGFMNPAEQGPSVLAIPDGSLFYAFAVVTSAFDDAGVLELAAGATSGTARVIGDYKADTQPLAAAAFQARPWTNDDDSTTVGTLAGAITKWVFAIASCQVWAGFFPVGSPTTGSADIYALIATPA